ncbi:MAG: adenylyl-sulfate kinase [Elusimicrobia bacterium]|nr:adenylyl-sulfate kinase [Elusimicrobiota bacterium]
MSGTTAERVRVNIVVVGHVDHGKSTVVGRLLADTGSLPQGRLEQIKDYCARNSRPFEYAYLLDALKDEQSQGITIDVARIFFRTALRDYMIIDAPGHIEFLKNMVSGASHASAALLVIDAAEGIRENSKRHGYILAMLGIRQIVVLVNKMDAAGYKEETYRAIVDEYGRFLAQLGVEASCFVPTAAIGGENLAARAPSMPWYSGPTVLEALDSFRLDPAPVDRPLRMPVQDVYKFTARGDDRRIVVGTVDAGSLKPGDQLVFYPSGKTSTVKSLETLEGTPPASASAGEAAGFTLSEQIYVRRGEVAALQGQPRPAVSKRLRAGVFWLGREPLRRGHEYVVKLGTARVRAWLESVEFALDASSLEREQGRDAVKRHEAAECVFQLDAPLAFDLPQDNPTLARFVLVDGFEISGGGLVHEALEDRATHAREKVILRNTKWRRSFIDPAARERRFGQKPALVLVTGSDDELRRTVAKTLEQRLFADGRFVYFLGIGSVLYGVDADIREGSGDHGEDIRRLAEVAHLMVDSGMILVVTASSLRPDDLELILTSVDAARVTTVWVGAGPTTGLSCDAELGAGSIEGYVQDIEGLLRRKGVIPGAA